MVEAEYRVDDFAEAKLIGYICKLFTAGDVWHLELAMRHTRDPKGADMGLSKYFYNAKEYIVSSSITSINKLVYAPEVSTDILCEQCLFKVPKHRILRKRDENWCTECWDNRLDK